MRFKQFISEPETSEDSPSFSIDSALQTELNYRLVNELSQPFLSPQAGIQAIRKVLHRSSYDMEALYGIDPEADEFAAEIQRFGLEEQNAFVYVAYYLTDDGHYEFYAEVGDEAKMDELLGDEEEDEEEE